MSALVVRLAVSCVRAWTWLYTWRMPIACRDARRAEIDSDLWESLDDAAGAAAVASALHIVLRLAIGIPDDVGWRVEQAVLVGSLNRTSIAFSARAAGAALFICALCVIDADAGRKRVMTANEGAARVIQSIEKRMSTSAANPSSGDTSLSLLTAGIMATIGGAMVPQLAAQSAPGAGGAPVFEAASVKPNHSGDPRITLVPQAGGRLTGTNVSAAVLIRFAFDLPDFQIVGGPAWLGSDRFDIAAKGEGDPSVEQKRLMLRSLLAERFRLAAHTETRELPIFALMTIRNDGKTKLRRTAADCASAAPAGFVGIGPSPSNGPPACGFLGMSPGTDVRSGRGGFAFRGLTMAALAKFLVPMVRRSVSDRTGLDGYFDADFDFLAELGPPPPPPGLPDPFDRASFSSVFTVFPEQLGLKLESTKGPVDVLVIDSVEHPTPD